MGLIVKIAFRNLFLHKGRSVVIGSILLIGALVMTLGNSIISGMEKGFETNIVQNWTGHILIVSSRQKNDDALFSPKPIKIIQDYNSVETIIKDNPNISSFLPATKGIAMILNIGDRKRAAELPVLCMLLGVDLQAYRKMFNDNISIINGNGLKNDEKGILINKYEQTKIYESENVWILPEGTPPDETILPADVLLETDKPETASSIVLMGIGDENSALDVFVRVKGIYKFNALNLLFKEINIIDLESFRECFEYVTDADSNIEISDENMDILDASPDSLDQYFSANNIIDEGDIEKDLGTESLKKDVSTEGLTLSTNKGAFNLVFVKLVSDKKLGITIQNLNNQFKSKNADARAVSWKDAIGYISDISLFFRVILNIFVFFIFFAAVIIIINTLSMATMERIPEIGTMRAIGARKSFIGKMFIIETSLLSFLFGGCGLVFGCILTFLIASLEIPASNEMMNLAFGGDTFRPMMDSISIINVFIQLMLVTIVAIIYPLHLAVKVSPVDAISRD